MTLQTTGRDTNLLINKITALITINISISKV